MARCAWRETALGGIVRRPGGGTQFTRCGAPCLAGAVQQCALTGVPGPRRGSAARQPGGATRCARCGAAEQLLWAGLGPGKGVNSPRTSSAMNSLIFLYNHPLVPETPRIQEFPSTSPNLQNAPYGRASYIGQHIPRYGKQAPWERNQAYPRAAFRTGLPNVTVGGLMTFPAFSGSPAVDGRIRATARRNRHVVRCVTLLCKV